MFSLPKLNYSFDALEPHLDKTTMEIHYLKHHQAYCDNFNKTLEKYPELQKISAEEILKNLNALKVDETDRTKIKNHGGGYLNHNFYWQIMSPEKQIDSALKAELEKTFGSTEEFKKQFSETAKTHFASGWTWLARDENNELKIYSLPNQDSPLSLGHTPVLCLDLWEHAYYLKYQNRRADFIEAWWNVVKII